MQNVTDQLQAILERRGKSLPKESIGGVVCYVAGNLVRPVEGGDWIKRRAPSGRS